METSAARRRPVGMLLVEAGAITVEDLVSALAEQRKTRRRLGEILIDSGAITWLQLAEAITEQARDLDPAAAPPPPPVSAQPAAPKTPPPPPTPPVSVSAVSAGRPEMRSTVTRLQDELAQRDAEITRLRALPLTG